MRSQYLTVVLLLVLPIISNAQKKIFKGRVFDSFSNEPIAGVTVSSLTNETVTSDDGNFSISIDTAYVKQPIIVFSSIGFKDKSIYINKSLNEYFFIQLDRDTTMLKEVIVASGVKSLVQKIVNNICSNYAIDENNVIGYLTNYINLNNNGYIASDTSILESYIPSYCSKKNRQTRIVQNKFSEKIVDSFLSKYDILGLYNVQVYGDFIWNQSNFLTIGNIDKYHFLLRHDTVINGIKYVLIDFRLKKEAGRVENVGGTIKIDMERHAIVEMKVRLLATGDQLNYKDSAYEKKMFSEQSTEYRFINDKYSFFSYKMEAETITQSKKNDLIIITGKLNYKIVKYTNTNVFKINGKDRVNNKSGLRKYRGKEGEYNWSEIEILIEKQGL